MMLKFELQEKVKLPKEIHKDIMGIVIAIYIIDKATQYQVRYFWEGKPQEVYFYEWELGKHEQCQ